MTEPALPSGWRVPDKRRLSALKTQFLRELIPGHPLFLVEFFLIAEHQAEDSVVAYAPGLNPRYCLLHLTWTDAPPRAPHEFDDLAELAGIFEPPGDTIDEISLWCEAGTEMGLVFVQHLLNGDEILDPIDWPAGLVPPRSAADLAAAGWRQITGPLHPHARVDGALVPTGQMVEYWVRPVIDDFYLLRAIHNPGEPISLRQLIPPDSRIILCDDDVALRAQLPRGYYCRATSPMSPGYGLSGFPRGD